MIALGFGIALFALSLVAPWGSLKVIFSAVACALIVTGAISL